MLWIIKQTILNTKYFVERRKKRIRTDKIKHVYSLVVNNHSFFSPISACIRFNLRSIYALPMSMFPVYQSVYAFHGGVNVWKIVTC